MAGATALGFADARSTIGADAEDKLAFYRKAYDSAYQENRREFDEMAERGGDDSNYYSFQYILDGTLSLFEATGDTRYLERALRWQETMLSKATIVDKSGHRNWSGPWISGESDTPISYQLWDLQGSTELARLARVILTQPALTAAYGKRGQAIYEFVRDDIVEKHVYTRHGESWFLSTADDLAKPFDDRTAHLLRILAEVHAVGHDKKYSDLARKLAVALKKRFEPYKGTLIWDKGVAWDGGSAMDTSHANRFPYAVVDLYRAGIVFTKDDVKGLADLLTKVIWNQSYDDPRFTNFIDGSNGEYQQKGPWENGLVYAGWVTLGEYDADAQKVCHAAFEAIMGGKSNPSLDYNSSRFGRIELAGHLAKNLNGSL